MSEKSILSDRRTLEALMMLNEAWKEGTRDEEGDPLQFFDALIALRNYLLDREMVRLYEMVSGDLGIDIADVRSTLHAEAMRARDPETVPMAYSVVQAISHWIDGLLGVPTPSKG